MSRIDRYIESREGVSSLMQEAAVEFETPKHLHEATHTASSLSRIELSLPTKLFRYLFPRLWLEAEAGSG